MTVTLRWHYSSVLCLVPTVPWFHRRTQDIAISEAWKFQHIGVRGEGVSIFLIESCDISLQAHFSVFADALMYVPYYNKWSADIYSSYE